jgi:hypothetical protein
MVVAAGPDSEPPPVPKRRNQVAGPGVGQVRVPAKVRPAPKAKKKTTAQEKTTNAKLTKLLKSGGLGLSAPLSGMQLRLSGVLASILPTTGVLETGANPSSHNNFQGRYAIRHLWVGEIECKAPRRRIWGANPKGASTPKSASGMAAVKRGALTLGKAAPAGIPELDIAPTK